MKNRYTIVSLFAVGCFALLPVAHAGSNTAYGDGTLASVTTGENNSAFGWGALFLDTTGGKNTAMGAGALVVNTTGNNNAAVGTSVLVKNTTGSQNTAVGGPTLFGSALGNNTTGANNTALGAGAGLFQTTGSNNVYLGAGAGLAQTTGSGNVYIGTGIVGVAGESDHTYIRNVHDTISSNRSVYVNPDGRIGTLYSSRRYKEEIKPMDQTSQVLYRLKPVTFRYTKEIDRAQVLSFGLVAEEAAGISPDLITRDREGKPETVRYEAVNAMLLNEFLKEHKTVQDQGKTIVRLEKQIKALTAGLQKVSAQIQINKTAPTVVRNNQ